MEKTITYLKGLPMIIKVTEVIFILSVVLYAIMFIDGGSFTTYFAMMLLCLTGFIAFLTSLFKKQWLLGTLNLCTVAVLFISYIYLA